MTWPTLYGTAAQQNTENEKHIGTVRLQNKKKTDTESDSLRQRRRHSGYLEMPTCPAVAAACVKRCTYGKLSLSDRPSKIAGAC